MKSWGNLNFEWRKTSIIFCLLSFLAICSNTRIQVNDPISDLPFWNVAHMLTHVSPNHGPMSFYTNPVYPIGKITAVFSGESIATDIFDSLFIRVLEIQVY